MTTRARRKPLSRDRVLTTAVALADAEGVHALTMRRLAAELGVKAMSLYYHLPAKEALLDGVVEAVLAEIDTAVERLDTEAAAVDATGAGAEWRTRLRRQFLTARQVMVQHPWAPALLCSRRITPPGVCAYYRGILLTLIEAGFTCDLAHRALYAFGSLPLGFTQEVFNPAPPDSNINVAALGGCDSRAEFEFTLDLLLDGLDRLRPDSHHPMHDAGWPRLHPTQSPGS
ncbi:MAG TPA: TetR/AcrR family transcriptional regulator [Actinoplanes sp.]|nr:TetR/AcrR family transcriptional regulator [Actinoplanes sp.]